MLPQHNESILSKITHFFITCYYYICDTNKREKEENPYTKLQSLDNKKNN
jgi:hypothetical protein